MLMKKGKDIVEGESVILAACFMAHLGHLSLMKIMLIAFCGTLFADQTLFYVPSL